MSSLFDRMVSGKNPAIKNYPKQLKNSIHYEVMTGSISYGLSTKSSDIDVAGFFIPPIAYIFPFSYGYIYGFGKKPPKFESYVNSHIEFGNDEYDLSYHQY